MISCEVVKMPKPAIVVRMPADVKAWIEAQAQRNGASQNSEIVRSIRARMDSEQPERAAG
jgi:deoxyribose-phosphate aldolase